MHDKQNMSKRLNQFLFFLVVLTLCLGLVHYFHHDTRVNGVYWFDLDADRNIATWFSVILVLLFSGAAVAACLWEKKRNKQGQQHFTFPQCWWLVAAFGAYLAIDEITLLHESLWWSEVRVFSLTFSDAWKYATQWQLLYAPVMLSVLVFFVVFFNNRFRRSPSARASSFIAISCWCVALLLEGVRESFLQGDARWYPVQVLIEETFEFWGAIALIAAIVYYCLDIIFDTEDSQTEKPTRVYRFFDKPTRHGLTSIASLLLIGFISIYYSTHNLSQANAPTPNLIKRVIVKQQQALLSQVIIKPKSFENNIWFDDVTTSEALSPAVASRLTKWIYAELQTPQTPQTPSLGFPSLPNSHPSILFLTYSDGKHAAKAVMGTGVDLQSALKQAIAQVNMRKPIVKLLKIDWVVSAESFSRANSAIIQPGLTGLALSKKSQVALLPEQVLVTHLFHPRQRPNRQVKKILTSLFSPRSDSYLFQTQSLFFDGKELIPLFRGHRKTVKPTQQYVYTALAQAGEYLKNSVKPNGQFSLSQSPEMVSSPKKYRLDQHASATVALLKLYETTQDKALLLHAKKALDYLAMQTQPCLPNNKEHLCIFEKGKEKPELNALAIIAFAKYLTLTDDAQFTHILFKLGKRLQTEPVPGATPFKTNGASMLAFMRLYATDKHPSWLASAKQVAKTLMQENETGSPLHTALDDPLLIIALHEYLDVNWDPNFFTTMQKIIAAITQSQNLHPLYTDGYGSMGTPPNTQQTAKHTESLISAVQTFRDHSHPQQATQTLTAAKRGIQFQLQLQYLPESTLYLNQPSAALGAFRKNFSEHEIDIETLSNNLLSLLGYHAILTTADVPRLVPEG